MRPYTRRPLTPNLARIMAKSHFWPRTKAGRLAVVAFLALFALTQPPLLYVLANRINPWVLGLPFLYAYLLALYVLLIAVLVWALRRDL